MVASYKYQSRAVVFSDDLEANHGEYVQTHQKLFLGSKETRKETARMMLKEERIQSSDEVYVALKEADLDDRKTQLALASLLRSNPAVRDFFLQDIFGNKVDSVEFKIVELPAAENISLRDLSQEVLQANLGLEQYQAYVANPVDWVRNNKEKVKEILSTETSRFIALKTQKAKMLFVDKLSLDVTFAYNFFTDWAISSEQETPNPQSLKALARKNPGAALAMLNNVHLKSALKSVLNDDDIFTLAKNAAAETANPKRKHYFRMTLQQLLPSQNPSKPDLAQLISQSPNPMELLRDLTDHAKYDGNLSSALTQQAVNIFGAIPVESAEKAAKLMKPFVVNLIGAYDRDKANHQAIQLNTLFSQSLEVVHSFNFSEAELGMLSHDQSFVTQNNPALWTEAKKTAGDIGLLTYAWMSFANIFGGYKAFFEKQTLLSAALNLPVTAELVEDFDASEEVAPSVAANVDQAQFSPAKLLQSAASAVVTSASAVASAADTFATGVADLANWFSPSKKSEQPAPSTPATPKSTSAAPVHAAVLSATRKAGEFVPGSAEKTKLTPTGFVIGSPAAEQVSVGDFVPGSEEKNTNSAPSNFVAGSPAVAQIPVGDYVPGSVEKTHSTPNDFVTGSPAVEQVSVGDFVPGSGNAPRSSTGGFIPGSGDANRQSVGGFVAGSPAAEQVSVGDFVPGSGNASQQPTSNFVPGSGSAVQNRAEGFLPGSGSAVQNRADGFVPGSGSAPRTAASPVVAGKATARKLDFGTSEEQKLETATMKKY
ncbi:MAG TPA: hypothetical protein VGV92_09550 [Gammaproteobacteria bacterium]|nr:hypothetical protein [Gammaproteobacteria bacterium]